MNLYPVFLNIEDQPVVVIGGGEVALRKINDLLPAKAIIKIIAPEIHPEIESLSSEYKNRITLLKREYQTGDIDGAILIFSATDSAEVNNAVFKESAQKGILINSADDPVNSSFYVPSHIRKGDLHIAVSTGGASPAMAASLRRKIQEQMPDNIEEILNALKEARSSLQNIDGLSSTKRGNILKKIVQDEILLLELTESFKKGRVEKFLKLLI